MGACGSTEETPAAPPGSNNAGGTLGPTVQMEAAQSSSIDRVLDKARQEEEGKVKLLLLGAGESGKSTIFKQMRILHGAPPTDDDLHYYGVVVRSNAIVAVRKLCGLLRTLGMEGKLDDEPRHSEDPPGGLTPRQAYDELMVNVVGSGGPVQESAKPVVPQAAENGQQQQQGGGGAVADDWVGHCARAGLQANDDSKMFLRHKDAIRTLWKSNTMKEVWTKRAQANVIDGHKEYLQDVNRIASPTYRPTQQDILQSRVRTTTVTMERYRIDGIDFEMYDVGGQRSERRKWIDVFDSVDAVIFVAALSEYDQSLAEARRTNRMIEALELFRSVCNNRAFANTSIMLFLNKKDIFAEKILYSDIAAQRPFADYAGPKQNFDEGVLYFIQKFKDCLIDDEFSDSFIHVTCATDTNNMEFVLDSTRTIIMTENLRRSGFLGSD